jgi:anti-sigma regulatory factor (Ser/Thr protein kinase)
MKPALETAGAFRLEIGIAVRAFAGESESGDACEVVSGARGPVVALADGLGHGPRAAHAARAFVDSVRDSMGLSLEDAFARAHRALLRTRGAVAAIARFDEERGAVEIGGIGNITAALYHGADHHPAHPVFVAGVLGSAYRSVRPQTFAFGVGDVLLLHSDGLRSRSGADLVHAVAAQGAADRLVQQHGKGSDDVACLVARGVSRVLGTPSRAPRSDGEGTTRVIPIRVSGDAACAANEARAFAARAGYPPRAQWEIGIAVSELATNVLKFAGAGEAVLRHETAPRDAIVVEVKDRGRGIADVASAVVDGFSEGARLAADRPRGESHGLGVGLGTVHRMMDTVEIESDATRGTRVVARKLRG